jgi:hypothetical protein
VQDSVDTPEDPRLTLDGVNVHVNPDGELVALRLTDPVNPWMLATVRFDVALPPARTVSEVGLAVTLKSSTL